MVTIVRQGQAVINQPNLKKYLQGPQVPLGLKDLHHVNDLGPTLLNARPVINANKHVNLDGQVQPIDLPKKK